MILRALMLHFARHRAAVYQLRVRHLLRSRERFGSQPRFVRGRPLDDPSTDGAPVARAVFHALLAEGVPSDVIRDSLAASDAPVTRDQPAPPTEQLASPIRPTSPAGTPRPPAITRPPVESRQREGRPADPAVPETPKVPGQRPTLDELRDVLLQLRARSDPAPAQPAAPAEPVPASLVAPRVRPSLGRRIEHVDHVVTDAALSTRDHADPTHADPAPVHSATKPPAPLEHAPFEHAPLKHILPPIAQPAPQESAPTEQAEEEARADAEPTHLTRLDAAAPPADVPMMPAKQQAALDHAEPPPLLAHDDAAKLLETMPETAAQTTAAPPEPIIDARPEYGVPIDQQSSEATAAPAALEPAPLPALEHTPPASGIRTSAPATPPERDHFDVTSLLTPDPAPTQAEQSAAITVSPTHAAAAALRQDAPATHVPVGQSLPAANTSDQLLAVPDAAGSAQHDGGPARAPAPELPEPVAHALALPASAYQPDVPPPVLETPAPMRMTTRRFLRPLLGFDPATTRIYRGPQAAQIATAHQAEAVTSGDQIALGAMHSSDTPQTLAVLAHELTHVARQRQPRFVPPIARISVGAAVSGNEERLAQLVEAHTAAAVDQTRIVPVAAPSSNLNDAVPAIQSGLGPIGQRAMDTRDSPNIAPSMIMPSRGIAPPADAPSAPTIASGLPMPWEPLPAWVPTGSSRQPARPFTAPAATPAVSTTPTQLPPTAAPAEAPMVQRAALNRSSPGRLTPPSAPPAPHQALATPPALDLDALAQQIYARIRQRLAYERRRMG